MVTKFWDTKQLCKTAITKEIKLQSRLKITLLRSTYLFMCNKTVTYLGSNPPTVLWTTIKVH